MRLATFSRESLSYSVRWFNLSMIFPPAHGHANKQTYFNVSGKNWNYLSMGSYLGRWLCGGGSRMHFPELFSGDEGMISTVSGTMWDINSQLQLFLKWTASSEEDCLIWGLLPIQVQTTPDGGQCGNVKTWFPGPVKKFFFLIQSVNENGLLTKNSLPSHVVIQKWGREANAPDDWDLRDSVISGFTEYVKKAFKPKGRLITSSKILRKANPQ